MNTPFWHLLGLFFLLCTWSQTTWRLQTSYHYLKLTWPKGSYGVLPSLGIRHYKVYGGFLLIRCTQKKEEAQKMSKGCVHIMGINYLLFIWCSRHVVWLHVLKKYIGISQVWIFCNGKAKLKILSNIPSSFILADDIQQWK
jgi:hypothetical protein